MTFAALLRRIAIVTVAFWAAFMTFAVVAVLLSESVRAAPAVPACSPGASTIATSVERLETAAAQGKLRYEVFGNREFTVIYAIDAASPGALILVFHADCLLYKASDLNPDDVAGHVFGAPSRAALFAPEKGA